MLNKFKNTYMINNFYPNALISKFDHLSFEIESTQILVSNKPASTINLNARSSTLFKYVDGIKWNKFPSVYKCS